MLCKDPSNEAVSEGSGSTGDQDGAILEHGAQSLSSDTSEEYSVRAPG